MKTIKPVAKQDYQGYFLTEQDGVLKCSCGRELVQEDENTFRCSGGYPVYRFSEGTIILDKFGNIMLKKIPHKNEEDD